MAWVATAVGTVSSIMSSGSTTNRARKSAAQQRQQIWKAMEWQQKSMEDLGYSTDEARNYLNQSVDKALAYYQPAMNVQTEGLSTLMNMMSPFIQSGQVAMGNQMALLGREIRAEDVANDPNFSELVSQGEKALTQQAAATGGLRGGNTQAALAQFRPRMIQDEIDRQYSRLFQRAAGYGNVAGMGLSAAQTAGQGAMQTAGNIGNMYAQMGGMEANRGRSLADLAMQEASGRGNIYSNLGNLELALGETARRKHETISGAQSGMYSDISGLAGFVGGNMGWF